MPKKQRQSGSDRVEDATKLARTLAKRRMGLVKKAMTLHKMTGADVYLMIRTPPTSEGQRENIICYPGENRDWTSVWYENTLRIIRSQTKMHIFVDGDYDELFGDGGGGKITNIQNRPVVLTMPSRLKLLDALNTATDGHPVLFMGKTTQERLSIATTSSVEKRHVILSDGTPGSYKVYHNNAESALGVQESYGLRPPLLRSDLENITSPPLASASIVPSLPSDTSTSFLEDEWEGEICMRRATELILSRHAAQITSACHNNNTVPERPQKSTLDTLDIARQIQLDAPVIENGFVATLFDDYDLDDDRFKWSLRDGQFVRDAHL